MAVRSILTSAAELERAHGVGTKIWVVDDAPDNDETREVAQRLGVGYLRITEHDGRADPGAAIVYGMQHVDTTWMTIFGDDDVMLPRHLPAAWEKIQEGHDVVSVSFVMVDSDLRPTAAPRILQPAHLGDLIAGYTWVNDGSFVKHALVKDLTWDVSLEGHMLLPLWAQLLLDERSFAVVEEPTWLYRRHDANISLGAMSPRDMALRERVRADIKASVLAARGALPDSPHEAREAERKAANAAAAEAKKAAAAAKKEREDTARQRRQARRREQERLAALGPVGKLRLKVSRRLAP